MEIFSSYTGPEFIGFYFVMLATCVFAGLWIPANLRPDGKRGSVNGIEETAVLAGGTTQHATALLADLFAQGALEDAEKGRLRVVSKELETSAAGRSILGEIGALKLGHVKSALKAHALEIEAALIERGLLMDQGQRMVLRLLSVLPYLALLVIGIYRQSAGQAAGEPTGFLVILLIATLLFAVIRLFRFNPRTMAGNEALRDLELANSRIQRAPQSSEAGMAVAIFGTGVLVGTPWEPVHAARQAAYGGGSGGDTGDHGSDGGDSGCGGGGCGGCGG